MSKYWILEGKTPKETDFETWGSYFEKANRHVGKDDLSGGSVSTVFLGIDHRFSDDGPPVLFETMIFGGELDQEQERYCTYEEAEEGHKRWVEKVKTKDTK